MELGYVAPSRKPSQYGRARFGDFIISRLHFITARVTLVFPME